jgi:hypothetical protein
MKSKLAGGDGTEEHKPKRKLAIKGKLADG